MRRSWTSPANLAMLIGLSAMLPSLVPECRSAPKAGAEAPPVGVESVERGLVLTNEEGDVALARLRLDDVARRLGGDVDASVPRELLAQVDGLVHGLEAVDVQLKAVLP